MAGHSHWAGIKHKKGKADKQRSKIFSKLSKEIHLSKTCNIGMFCVCFLRRFFLSRIEIFFLKLMTLILNFGVRTFSTMLFSYLLTFVQ